MFVSLNARQRLFYFMFFQMLFFVVLYLLIVYKVKFKLVIKCCCMVKYPAVLKARVFNPRMV